MNDLEQPMLSYYVIYFEKVRKIMQQTEKEALHYNHTSHILLTVTQYYVCCLCL